MNYEEQYDLLEKRYADKLYEQPVDNKCDECNVINYDGMNVCQDCGIVYEYDFVQEYNVYERCTINQKSIYKRKTYLQVILAKYNIQRAFWGELTSLFCKMERIFEKEDMGRHNMISYNTTIRRILRKLHEFKEAKKIPLLKTKKTRIIHHNMFNKLWDKLQQSEDSCSDDVMVKAVKVINKTVPKNDVIVKAVKVINKTVPKNDVMVKAIKVINKTVPKNGVMVKAVKVINKTVPKNGVIVKAVKVINKTAPVKC